MTRIFARPPSRSLLPGLCLSLLMGLGQAHAVGIRPAGTFLVRDLKPAASEQHIQIGVRVEGSPMQALAKQAIAQAKQDHPQIAEVVDLLREVDPESLQTMDATAIQNTLLALPGITPEQEAIIKSKVNSGTRDQVLMVLDALQDKEEAIVFGIRPFARLNFPGVRATVEVPVAGFHLAGKTTFALGNANLELAFAHSLVDESPVGLGIGYGIHVYAPTGTERSNTLAYQNLLDAPAYLHEYLSPSIFLVFGLQMPVLSLVTHGEITPMFALRDVPRRDLMISGRYGIAAVIDLEILRLQAELAGRVNIKDAEPLESLYFLAGGAFDIVFMQLEAAFVIPILSVDSAGAGALPSADLGSASDYMLLVRLGFGI